MSPCSCFDSQAIAMNVLSFHILFSEEPPPFNSVWAGGSGNDTMSETLSFRISSKLFLRTATAFFDHRTMCKEFMQKHKAIVIHGKAEDGKAER